MGRRQASFFTEFYTIDFDIRSPKAFRRDIEAVAKGAVDSGINDSELSLISLVLAPILTILLI